MVAIGIGKIEAQSREVPGAPPVIDGEGPVVSARVVEERDRVLGQGLAEEAERAHADLVKMAKRRESDAGKQLEVHSPARSGAQTKDVVDTRRVPTCEEVGSEQKVKARLVAKGSQDPDLRRGAVDSSGYMCNQYPGAPRRNG